VRLIAKKNCRLLSSSDIFILSNTTLFLTTSSIAAIRGGGDAPAYNASKAFVSNYLEGLRQMAAKMKLPLTVTDIKPGFVDTVMAQGEGLFWVAPAEKAAKQILEAVEKKKDHAYVTKRWRLVAWVLKLLPGRLYCKI